MLLVYSIHHFKHYSNFKIFCLKYIYLLLSICFKMKIIIITDFILIFLL